MTDVPPSTALRRAVLVVTLRDDGDLAALELTDAGPVLDLPDGRLLVAWSELAAAAADPSDEAPEPVVARRVARWLRLRIALARALGARPPGESGPEPDAARAKVVSTVRLRALPPDHPLHPGPSWVRRAVLGGALDVGLALRGFDDDGRPDPEAVGLVPAALLVAAGIDVAAATARAERHLTDMAALAAERLRRDPTAVLRPLGDADVLTLLASRDLRTALVDGQGMRSAAIPMRTRGWLDLGRLDPAFALAAASLTEPDERGFARPVLVMVDEVALIRAGGDPVRHALADPAPPDVGAPPRRRPA